MAVTIVADVGSPTANSYVTLAEADAYFSDSDGAATWAAETDDDKRERALVQATNRIDQERFEGRSRYPLVGRSTTGTVQALKWPRHGCVDDEGWTVDETVIPAAVKRATFELALEILAGGFSLSDSGLEAFENVVLGPISVAPRQLRRAGELPANVRRYLRPFLKEEARAAFRMLRG